MLVEANKPYCNAWGSEKGPSGLRRVPCVWNVNTSGGQRSEASLKENRAGLPGRPIFRSPIFWSTWFLCWTSPTAAWARIGLEFNPCVNILNWYIKWRDSWVEWLPRKKSQNIWAFRQEGWCMTQLHQTYRLLLRCLDAHSYSKTSQVYCLATEHVILHLNKYSRGPWNSVSLTGPLWSFLRVLQMKGLRGGGEWSAYCIKSLDISLALQWF